MSISKPMITYKNYQRLHGTMIYIIYNMSENIVVILHIYRASAIFLLLCDYQETEYEPREIKIEFRWLNQIIPHLEHFIISVFQ